MNLLKKIAGWNLLAILVYSLVIRIISYGMDRGSHGTGTNDTGMAIAIFSAIAVGLHVMVCVALTIAEFASGRPASGRAWLLSSGIVLLVGFSACLGNASL